MCVCVWLGQLAIVNDQNVPDFWSLTSHEHSPPPHHKHVLCKAFLSVKTCFTSGSYKFCLRTQDASDLFGNKRSSRILAYYIYGILDVVYVYNRREDISISSDGINEAERKRAFILEVFRRARIWKSCAGVRANGIMLFRVLNIWWSTKDRATELWTNVELQIAHKHNTYTYMYCFWPSEQIRAREQKLFICV